MTSPNNSQNFKEIEEEFVKDQGLPFREALSEEEIREVIEEQNIEYRNRTLTPIITLWAFLSQVLCNGSCKKSVDTIVAFFASIGEFILLTDSAYCQARDRLTEGLLKALTRKVSHTQLESLPPEELWQGRRVKIIDGSSATMPDTEKNQEEYPQSSRQREGCGFPLARIVVLFCLATGMVLEMCIAPMSVSERRLFQKIYQNLTSGDVVLGDRGCCSYAEIALLMGQDIDSVFRMHASRKVDFRRGTWIGRYDHIVTWYKPNCKPAWMTVEEFENLPETIVVREIRYSIEIPGFRSQEVTVVTTLLDPTLYPKEALADLYRRRWAAELYLRDLKTTMKMNFIDSKTPEMVRKQVWVHLLAYNLIRRLMWQAGERHNIPPLRISFKGTIDVVAAYLPKLVAATPERFELVYTRFLWAIAERRVPYRPNRYEPRRLKRRRNPAYPLMHAARSEYRRRIDL